MYFDSRALSEAFLLELAITVQPAEAQGVKPKVGEQRQQQPDERHNRQLFGIEFSMNAQVNVRGI